MKYINFYLIAVISVLPIFCYGAEKNRFVSEKIKIGKTPTRSPMYLVIDSQLYVTGGVTFSYPACLFSSAPTVQVLLESDPVVVPPTYIAEVVSNTSTETVVMVYQVSTIGGVVSVTEVPAGSVTVSLNASESPA